MQNYNKKRKATSNASHTQLELATLTAGHEAINEQRSVMTTNVDDQTDQISVKDVCVQAGQTAVTSNEETNRERNKMSREIYVPTKRTTIMLNIGETYDIRDITKHGIKIQINSPATFVAPCIFLNGRETLDLTQEPVVAENSNDTPNNPITNNRRTVEVVEEQLTLTTSKIINNVETDFGAILGYADEPLLPLVKACAPLTNIILNLSYYVELALNETPEQPPDDLTIDESAAIRLYTMEWTKGQRSLYSMLNYTLKYDTRNNLRPYFKYLKLFLTALAKLPCVPQATIWRGVTIDLRAQFSPGTSVIWWAFSSCTTSLPVLENNMYLGTMGNRTLFSVDAINGRTIGAHSHFDTEDEILLLPGTQMIVQSQFSPAPDLHIVHLKQVIPEEVLLEPPFEGIETLFNHLF